MGKFVVATANFDGELKQELIEAENALAAGLKIALREEMFKGRDSEEEEEEEESSEPETMEELVQVYNDQDCNIHVLALQ